MYIVNYAKVALRNLFMRPATLAVKPPFERTRGHVVLDGPHCVFCGICQKKCPTGTIEVNRKASSWSIGHYNCILCGSCVENCPKKCLSMDNTHTHAGALRTREDYARVCGDAEHP